MARRIDDLNGLAKLSVREYAKLKDIQPQLVYYYLRKGYIKEEQCICGRKVIDIASAEAFLKEKAAKANNGPQEGRK